MEAVTLLMIFQIDNVLQIKKKHKLTNFWYGSQKMNQKQ